MAGDAHPFLTLPAILNVRKYGGGRLKPATTGKTRCCPGVSFSGIDSDGGAGYAPRQCNNVGWAYVNAVSIILMPFSSGSHCTAIVDCERRFLLHNKDVHGNIMRPGLRQCKFSRVGRSSTQRSIERETA